MNVYYLIKIFQISLLLWFSPIIIFFYCQRCVFRRTDNEYGCAGTSVLATIGRYTGITRLWNEANYENLDNYQGSENDQGDLSAEIEQYSENMSTENCENDQGNKSENLEKVQNGFIITEDLMDKDESETDDSDFEEGDDFATLQMCNLDIDNLRKKYTNGTIEFLDKPPELFEKENMLEPIPEESECNINDIWDSKHVKMPFSERNQVNHLKKWEIIKEELSKTFSSGEDLEKAIKSFNDNLSKFDFDVLRQFIDTDTHFDALKIVNELAKQALELPRLFYSPIPLLRTNDSKTIFLTQKQIAGLLANGFFCTFPRRSKPNMEYANFPLFNFASLYSSNNKQDQLQTKTEKLKCIFNYFNRTLSNYNLNGRVSFERRCLSSHELPDWSHSEKPLIKVKVQNSGRMEIVGKNYSVVDFANKFIGGGVLSSGCVQEEIIFLIYPELLVSKLFYEAMADSEAIVITGHSTYSSNEGYSKTFKWTGDYVDSPETDNLGRKFRQIIAIDAMDFNNVKYIEESDQFDGHNIQRELNKAYVGFRGLSENEQGEKPAIVTGKWGCGAFKGDPALKYLIQLLAASEAERNLIFYTFNDRDIGRQIKEFNSVIMHKCVNVKQLYHLVCDFINDDYPSLFTFILDNL